MNKKIKKRLSLLIIGFTLISPIFSQNRNSITANWHYLNRMKSHGIGVGYSRDIGRNFLLLTDLNYFFRNYHGEFHKNYQKEWYDRYSDLNIGVGYRIALFKNLSLIPNIGAGFFLHYRTGYMKSDGVYIPPGSGVHPGVGAPYHQPFDENLSTLVLNLSLMMQYDITERLSAVAGVKGSFDAMSTDYSNFPYLTLGLAYSF